MVYSGHIQDCKQSTDAYKTVMFQNRIQNLFLLAKLRLMFDGDYSRRSNNEWQRVVGCTCHECVTLTYGMVLEA